ncbi:MAG: hypothetical protein M3R27_01310 [Bacteroidota bacterium]|nr:hypothetical protein [Bacteroidota bacterium]
MKRIFSTMLFVTAIAITFNACKKEEPDTETQSAVDNSLCEGEFTRVMNTVNSFGINEQGVKSMSRSASPTITIDPADTLDGFPVTMIVDYGTGTTDSVDGKTRKGQMICVFSDNWTNVGAKIKINLVNYSVNGVAYAVDSVKLTHNATFAFTTDVFKGVCTNPSWTLEWACNRTFTQLSGMGTPENVYDDVFQLTGNASGVTREGKGYTVSIQSPIVRRTSCTWIESGRLDLTPDGLATRTVDFGNGTCDNQATLTINGNSFTFTMN